MTFRPFDLQAPVQRSLSDYERIAESIRDRLLDVSKLVAGAPCPRCSGHRVYATDENKNLWLCIENARPIPAFREQLVEHDAAEYTQDQQVKP